VDHDLYIFRRWCSSRVGSNRLLRGQGFQVVHVHDENWVLAFHRWVARRGLQVIAVAHLSTFNRFGYGVGLPASGVWREVFNSDVYESWVNPNVVGNGGSILADGLAMHGFEQSASLVLPANRSGLRALGVS
jgi:1,4-alpha-glucan branching enzyme